MPHATSSSSSSNGDAISRLTTQCPRCQGFLTPLRYSDWAIKACADSSRAWECVLCGEVIDPVIIANRRPPKKRHANKEHTPHSSSTSSKPFGEGKQNHAPAGLPPEVISNDCSRHEYTIMTVLRDSRSLTIEELLERVPDVSWSQIFLTIGKLSRKGAITLHRCGFTYTIETVDHRRSKEK